MPAARAAPRCRGQAFQRRCNRCVRLLKVVALHKSRQCREMSYNVAVGDVAGVMLPLAIATASHCIANFFRGIAIGKIGFGE